MLVIKALLNCSSIDNILELDLCLSDTVDTIKRKAEQEKLSAMHDQYSK